MRYRVLICCFSLSIFLAACVQAEQAAVERHEGDAAKATAGNLVGRESPFVDRTKKGPIGMVFFGDSITADWTFKSPETWSLLETKFNAVDFGISGESTENVIWRLHHGDLDNYHAKVYVVLIGTNNVGHFPQEKPEWTAEGVKTIVTMIREKQPQAKILLLAIFPRDDKGSVLYNKVLDINKIIIKLADNQHVIWLDLFDAFAAPDGIVRREIMGDNLHPNDAGYHIWYGRMLPTLEKLFNAK